MVVNGPGLNESIGADALSVWMDFWELTGRMRADIKRVSYSGGDKSIMDPPDTTTITIAAVPVILIGRKMDEIQDRSGDIPKDILKLEFIDTVRNTDRLEINGISHEISSVIEKSLGEFSIWTVEAHRIE